jgi:hypothetical protein
MDAVSKIHVFDNKEEAKKDCPEVTVKTSDGKVFKPEWFICIFPKENGSSGIEVSSVTSIPTEFMPQMCVTMDKLIEELLEDESIPEEIRALTCKHLINTTLSNMGK